jgi:hypothetical protein
VGVVGPGPGPIVGFQPKSPINSSVIPDNSFALLFLIHYLSKKNSSKYYPQYKTPTIN